MSFVEHNDMIEQLLSAAFHPSLCHPVLPRTLKGGSRGPASDPLHGRNHFLTELLIAVKAQILVARLEGECFAQLLDHPQAGRVGGDVAMQDAPTVMSKDKKAVVSLPETSY
ncbi:MAG: hypothetical protein HY237_13510 [Acidobacteria bacterium]|nr:hypothetical protein [Acidobacteriota bacterium]